MEELIYKFQAVDAIVDELEKIDHVPKWVFDRLEGRLKQLPSAEPKSGKWIEMPYVPSHTKYMCSECGKTIYTNGEYIKEHKFCFSCGAKMER